MQPFDGLHIVAAVPLLERFLWKEQEGENIRRRKRRSQHRNEPQQSAIQGSDSCNFFGRAKGPYPLPVGLPQSSVR